MIQPLWRTVQRFLKKLDRQLPYEKKKTKKELPYNPTIPLLGIYPEETIIERDTGTPIFMAALFIIARTWKQPRCPSTNTDKGVVVYIYTVEYYSAIKKKECIQVSPNEVD